MIQSSIITIGDELLIGQVIDTNSAWMAQVLNAAGIPVRRRVSVGDNAEQIRKALDEESATSTIILITGGLGPTADDITKPLLANYFGGKMITHAPTLQHVKHLFEIVFKRPLLERNLKQAEVPDSCEVLFNSRGTAPGMWFEKNGKIFVSMPGVPHEMKGLMTDEVIPRLRQQFKLPHIAHRTLVTFGVGESFLAELLVPFEAVLPSTIRLAYLPHFSLVRLRLSIEGNNKADVESTIDNYFNLLKNQVRDQMISEQDERMEDIVARLLLEKNKTLCTAESCTGGYIAQLITKKPGASAYFLGGIVSYANEVKKELLNVEADSLSIEGAVSKSVVEQMASGALKQIKADYSIAVSGIMGPEGGSPEKPVGTVWIAVASQHETVSKMMHFRFDRERNIELTAMNALNMLRMMMMAGGEED